LHATGARRSGTDAPVVLSLDDGTAVEGDELLVAVGRRPATSTIGIDSVGLTPGKFIEVDDQFRAVGVPGGWLYAVGDCNGRALLTHMGKYQARLAGDVILGKDVADVADHDKVPRVTFTDPQVCAVGLTEAQAREQGVNVKVVMVATGDVAGAYTSGNGVMGTSQLVIDEDRHVIIGATFTGPNMQELLHSATIAVVAEVPLETLWHAVPSFPTVSEVWLRLLEAYGL
jgi:dihydrolipoamide dehydrogenase